MAFPVAAMIPIITALVGAAIQAAPTAEDKANRARIRELQGRPLGLQEAERAELSAERVAAAQVSERQLLDLLPSGSGGQAFAERQAAADRMVDVRTDAARDIQRLDEQRREAERVELQQLLGARGASQRQRAAAIAGGIAQAGGAAVGGIEDAQIERLEGVDAGGLGAVDAIEAGARTAQTPGQVRRNRDLELLQLYGL